MQTRYSTLQPASATTPENTFDANNARPTQALPRAGHRVLSRSLFLLRRVLRRLLRLTPLPRHKARLRELHPRRVQQRPGLRGRRV